METQIYRVLLIEDDKLDQMAFERLVDKENLPYNYAIAGSVAEAKNRLIPEDIDVIVADYNLGDGTIFEIIDLMCMIPTIITTGAGGEDIAVKAMRKGIFDYLIKDVERNYLKVLPVIIENAIKHKMVNDQVSMLSHAMKNISDSVFITNEENHIIFVNRSFCETYNYSEKEILNKNPELFHNNILDGIHPSNANLEKNTYGEFYHFKKGRIRFPVSLSCSKILDDSDKKIATVWVARDITERKRAEEGMKKLVSELKEALAKVKTLSGFLPICSSCKNIRDDQGYWNQIEQYIKDHSDAEFSHSLCPECARNLYPELYEQ